MRATLTERERCVVEVARAVRRYYRLPGVSLCELRSCLVAALLVAGMTDMAKWLAKGAGDIQ